MFQKICIIGLYGLFSLLCLWSSYHNKFMFIQVLIYANRYYTCISCEICVNMSILNLIQAVYFHYIILIDFPIYIIIDDIFDDLILFYCDTVEFDYFGSFKKFFCLIYFFPCIVTLEFLFF